MKKKTKLVAVSAAIVGLSLALVGGGVTATWDVFNDAPVLEVTAETPVFTLGDVYEVNNNNIRILFTQNFVAADAANQGEVDTTNNGGSYIEYKFAADGSTANPSHIRTEANAQTFKLYFLNNSNVVLNTAAAGDTITIKAGFTLTDYAGNTYTIGESDVVYVSQGGGIWLPQGEELPVFAQEDITIATEQASFAQSGAAILLDFGLTDVGGEQSLVDTVAFNGWAAYSKNSEALNTEIATYFTYQRNGVAMTCGRYVMGQGKFGWDLGGISFTDKSLVKGDVLTLKAGFTLYSIDVLSGVPASVGVSLPETITAVGKVGQDMSWTFDGSAWQVGVLDYSLPEITQANVTIATEKVQFAQSGAAILLDFGLTNVGGEQALVDTQSANGWVAYAPKSEAMHTEVATYFTVERNGVAMTCGRYVMGQGKFGWDLGCMSFDSKELVIGDVLTLKEGFKLYCIDTLNATVAPYGVSLPDTVTAVAEVTEDMSWTFTGTEWKVGKLDLVTVSTTVNGNTTVIGVEKGSAYTPVAPETNDIFVGWYADGALQGTDYSIASCETNVSMTAVIVGFDEIGVSIKTAGTQGLRFKNQVKAESVALLESLKLTATYGTMLTHETLGTLHIATENWLDEENKVFAAVLTFDGVDEVESYYDDVFTATAYVEINGVKYYANATQSASIAYVANLAVNDSATNYSEAERNYLATIAAYYQA